MTYYKLQKQLYENLEDRIEDFLDDEKDNDEIIHETVDNLIPIYTYDLLKFAENKLELAVVEPEIMAFTGENNAINAIAGNLFELLREDADDWMEKNINNK